MDDYVNANATSEFQQALFKLWSRMGGKVHRLMTVNCWCLPRVEHRENGVVLVYHRVHDRRAIEP